MFNLREDKFGKENVACMSQNAVLSSSQVGGDICRQCG